MRCYQGYGGAQAVPASEYQAESSRGSDLSDILEEEEEDLYSDPPGERQPRGYTVGANRVTTHPHTHPHTHTHHHIKVEVP